MLAGSMPEEVAEVPPVVIISEPAPAPPVPQPGRQEAQPLPVAATLDVSSILCIEGAPEDDDEDDDDDGDMEDGPRLKNSKLGVCKKAWTAAEDKILQEVVEKNGAHRWSTVAGYLPGRMGKQCRERCARHVAPSPLRPARRARANQADATGVLAQVVQPSVPRRQEGLVDRGRGPRDHGECARVRHALEPYR